MRRLVLWWIRRRARRLSRSLVTDPFRPRTERELQRIVRAQGHEPVDPPSGFGRNLAGELHERQR